MRVRMQMAIHITPHKAKESDRGMVIIGGALTLGMHTGQALTLDDDGDVLDEELRTEEATPAHSHSGAPQLPPWPATPRTLIACGFMLPQTCRCRFAAALPPQQHVHCPLSMHVCRMHWHTCDGAYMHAEKGTPTHDLDEHQLQLSREFQMYAFEGASGQPRWRNAGTDFRKDLEDLEQVLASPCHACMHTRPHSGSSDPNILRPPPIHVLHLNRSSSDSSYSAPSYSACDELPTSPHVRAPAANHPAAQLPPRRDVA